MPPTRSGLADARKRRSLNTRILAPRFDDNDGFEWRFRKVQADVLGAPFKAAYEECAQRDNLEFSMPPPAGVPKPTDPRPPPLTLKDLECIKTLGRSSCQVLLVRSKRKSHHLDTGSVYALKAIPRKLCRKQAMEINVGEYDRRMSKGKEQLDLIVKEQMLEANSERSSLVDASWNPFISNLLQTFHDAQNLYLSLEYSPGGTLRPLLQENRCGMKPREAIFYFANIVSALEHLHDLRIVHRDLKPENIMVNSDGYLCLTDFGTAARFHEDRYIHGRQWKDVGTPCYMAPECDAGQIMHPKSYPAALDWWAAGCILFEMATGRMAFYDAFDGLDLSLQKAAASLDWPVEIRVGKKLKDLVENLLELDPSSRLGTAGVSDVHAHPWLEGVDWDKMRHRQYLPPFVPKPVDMPKLWQRSSMPEQSTVPGLALVDPPLHLQNDDRFPNRWAVRPLI